jgi:hypothetical protein
MLSEDDIRKHEEFWTEIHQFRLWLFWTLPRERTLSEGFVYCPDIPEPFKNWTHEQWKEEVERLENLKGHISCSFIKKINISQ